jgi:hypothetical protein
MGLKTEDKKYTQTASEKSPVAGCCDQDRERWIALMTAKMYSIAG